MANTIRTPRQGVTANSRRIAEAVDNEEWQKFRVSMKGKSTDQKLKMLADYYVNGDLESQRECLSGDWCDVCIRVDNYIKALCRGGQLYPGESLETAVEVQFNLRIKRN